MLHVFLSKMAPFIHTSIDDKTNTKLKKKRGNKHKKKSWRKNSDIKDVEDFLDDKRKEEKYKSKAQRTDDELFIIQSKISAKEKAAGKKKKNSIPTPKFKYLQPESEIEPIVKPSVPRTKKSSRNPIQKAKFRVAGRVITANKPQKEKIGKNFLSMTAPCKDIWQDDKKEYENEYLEAADDFFKQQTCKKRVTPPSSYYNKPSPLDAVEVPDAGASYNPTYDDHQKLLLKAHQVEMKKLKEEKHLNRVLTNMFPSKDEAPTETTWLTEMSQGLNQEEAKGEESEIDDRVIGNPPTLNRKKTKTQRNKEMRQKLIEEKMQKEKLQKQRENEVYKIKTILSDIKKKEKITKIRQSKRIRRKIERMHKPARLGRNKYEEPDIELTLTSELKGNLRSMKPQGSLLLDRLKSFQRRNMIEPLIPQTHKRTKLKRYTKKNHKEC